MQLINTIQLIIQLMQFNSMISIKYNRIYLKSIQYKQCNIQFNSIIIYSLY